MFLMGSLASKNPSSKKNNLSPRTFDFGKREGHGDVTGNTSPKYKNAYPAPETYDIRNAYQASSLSKRMPNLVNMDKEAARNSSSLYSKADIQYMKEAARE
jgi:hypothetical protein